MGEYFVFIKKMYAIRSKNYFDLLLSFISTVLFCVILDNTNSPDTSTFIYTVVQIIATLLGFSISIYAIFTTIFNDKSSPGNIKTDFIYQNKSILLFEWFSLALLKILAVESILVISNLIVVNISFNEEISIFKSSFSFFSIIYVLLINFRLMIQNFLLINSR